MKDRFGFASVNLRDVTKKQPNEEQKRIARLAATLAERRQTGRLA
jgi:hypothetical protein